MSVGILVVSLLACAVSICCACIAVIAAGRTGAAIQRCRSTEAEVAALATDVDMVLDTVKRMEGRQTGRLNKKTARAADPDREPDAAEDPEAWKAWQNRRLTTVGGRPQ